MNNPGWSCPKCGSVYAPWVRRCEECPKVTKPPPIPKGITLPDMTGCGCPVDYAGRPMHHSGCSLGPKGPIS